MADGWVARVVGLADRLPTGQAEGGLYMSKPKKRPHPHKSRVGHPACRIVRKDFPGLARLFS
jgi:hypothetical protein